MMAFAQLPKNCTVDGLVSALAKAGVLAGDWKSIVIDIPPGGFIHTSAMAFLSCWGIAQVKESRRVNLRGDDSALRYLARMDVHDHLRIPHTEGARRNEHGRFIPVRIISNHTDVQAATNELCAVVKAQCANSSEVWPAVDWAVNEILDNVLEHSETESPGVLCAQVFPKRNRLDIAIADVGQGIYASLSQAMPLFSHGHAVSTALRRGVTRSQDVGQGNGMAGVKVITERSAGNLDVWTGDVVFHAVGGEEKGFTQIEEVPGTGVMFSLRTDRPVDLSDTWIAACGPMTHTMPEAAQLIGAGAAVGLSAFLGAGTAGLVKNAPTRASHAETLNVRSECQSTGTRSGARALRRKTLQLLLSGTQRVNLEFDGVTSATSSFLDELLGRMVEEVGPEVVADRVTVQGMQGLVARMAATVIQQRAGMGRGDSEVADGEKDEGNT